MRNTAKVSIPSTSAGFNRLYCMYVNVVTVYGNK